MPSVIGYKQHNRPAATRRAEDLAQQTGTLHPVVAVAPWHGWVPDIDVAHLGPSAARSVANLIPRTDPSGRGEGLFHFPGFDHLDSTYDDTTSGTELGEDVGSSHHIVGLGYFPRRDSDGETRGEFDETTFAITAGDATADSCEVWRLLPSTGLWQQIAPGPNTAALVGAYPASEEQNGVQLFDYAVTPFSATPRNGSLEAMTDGGPLLVFTNNYDNVQVYAVDDTGTQEDGDYEDLHVEDFTTFKARSVELWGDRLNFFNTYETDTRYARRLRRTAIGTADPDPGNDGSGALDLEGFSGEGLRVEALGNVLACYLEDGVAFVRRTGQAVSPYTVQEVTTTRGLLATHALCNLGGGIHFGLFTDGWFYINENGQFKEVGITNVDGVPTPKWRETFFRRLNMNLRARIDVQYDHTNRWIYLTLPLDDDEENSEVWVYEIEKDRLWTRDISVTKFGGSNVQVRTATTIGGLSGTIGGLGGTIGSYAAAFGVQQMLHGTSTGHVYRHTPEAFTEIDKDTGNTVTPSWLYETVLTGYDRPHEYKSVAEVFVEAYLTTSDSFSGTVTNEDGETSIVTYSPTAAEVGTVATLSGQHRFSGTQLSHALTGQAPFGMRSQRLDLRLTGSRKRRYG